MINLFLFYYFKQKDFMGRFYVKPVMNVSIPVGKTPKLSWYELYYNNEPAGDILASFEMILLNVRNCIH